MITQRQIESSNIHLADDPLSTDCYSVRLLLEFLQYPYLSVYQDIEQLEQVFECPVLLNTQPPIVGTFAILTYLVDITQTQAQWLPAPLEHEIATWSALNEKFKANLGQLRQAYLSVSYFLANEVSLKQDAQQLLAQLEQQLCEQTIRRQRFLLTADHPTLADVMLFPQVALAWDAGVSLVPFLHIRRWIYQMRQRPHYIPMAGLLAAS